MKVLALVSGGKDSTMNMIKCKAEGHEIVALANLYPPTGKEELDSFMYQSVGHDAIEAFAECCELPLYRAPISGRPVNQAYDYEPTVEDEVEDLFQLIRSVLEKHPDIKGISSGAIHSTYQKNRVENVCARLGLVSLAYLWGREQSGLLREMIESGIKAVLVKTAVIGLDSKHLLRTIGQMEETLNQLKDQYGVNVCGEGGEFESLTLDCPLFPRFRMQIAEHKVVNHKQCSFAPVNYVKIKKISLIPKSN